MALVPLTDAQNCADFFERCVLANLYYWRDYVIANSSDGTALERDWQAIVKAITYALPLPTSWQLLPNLILAFSPFMERRGYWETWVQCVTQAMAAARQQKDLAGIVTLNTLLARLRQRQSRPAEAIPYYRQVISLARQLGDHFSQGRACTNLGYLYIEQGRWWRAEILCRYALQLFEEIDSAHGRAHTENHLGILYTHRRMWNQAQSHLERACALWQSMDDSHGLMRGLINLGALYNDVECPEKSLFYLAQAVKQAQLNGEEAELGTIYMNMGVAYRLQGEFSQATASILRAKEIFQRFAYSLHLAFVEINLGGICCQQKKWAATRAHLETALVACRNLKSRYGEIKTLMGLIEYELARSETLEADAWLRELEKLILPHERLRWQSLLEKYYSDLQEISLRTSEAS